MNFNTDFQDMLDWFFNEGDKVYFIGEKFNPNVALGLHKDGYITYFIRTYEGILFCDSVMPLSKGLYTQKYACVDKEDFEKGVYDEKVCSGAKS